MNKLESLGWFGGVIPRDEITGHFPIMRAIFDCLPGRELMSTRLLHSTWNKFITDLIQKKERVGTSPLSPVDLTDLDTLRYFLTQFPEGLPPLGLKLFNFTNINLCVAGTRLPELTQMATIHGQYLKYLTLSIPRLPDEGNPFYETIRFILNKCPGIETLCLQDSKNPSHQLPVQNQGVTALEPIPNLLRIETKCFWSWGFLEFMHDIVRKAPNLRIMKGVKFTKINTGDEVEENQYYAAILDFFKSTKHVPQSRLRISLDFTSPGNGIISLLNGIREMKIRILNLHLSILAEDPVSEEVKKTMAEALGKLDILILNIECSHKQNENRNNIIRLRLPPTLSISFLTINSFLESPIIESQVPNLEEVEIPAWGIEPFHDRENPFDTRSVFPEMKDLLIVMNNQAATWRFGFPNLETLCMRFPVEAVSNLGTFLAQFPAVVSLNIYFSPESSKKSQREAWWDLFTGGSRPVMTHLSPEDVILGNIPQVTQNSRAPLLQGLPKLKRLKIEECPEVIAYAILKLTATGEMQNLEALEFDSKFPQINCYLATLKRYHARVKISTLREAISSP